MRSACVVLLVALLASLLVASASAQFNLDEMHLFGETNAAVKLSPHILSGINWYSCPLYSTPLKPVYENITTEEDNDKHVKDYHDRILKTVREHINGKKTFDVTEVDISIERAIRENLRYGVMKIPQAECAVVPLPLDYNNATNNPRTINVFVKRLRQSTTKTAEKSLWLLQGGPGGPYTAFEKVMHLLQSKLPNFDLYTMDHRGVGYSTRLGCVATQAETPGSEAGVEITDEELYDCARAFKNEYGDDTDKFSPTGAAWDLAALVATTNELYNYKTHIYGVSYGTFWLTRFLQISEENNFVNIIESAIMDGVVSTSSNTENPDEERRLQFTQWDKNMNEVGIHLLQQYCNNSTVCYKKLDKDPVKFMETVFQHLYVNKTCTKFTDGKTTKVSEAQLRTVLGSFLLTLDTRELIPAILYRLHRCDPDVDIPALEYLFNNVLQQSTEAASSPPLFSTLLHRNIGFSELFPLNLELANYEKLYAAFNQTYMATGSYMEAMTLEISKFPRYQPDQYFNKASKPQVPVLLLNGDLDAQTPLKSAVWQAENMGTKNVRLIQVPYALHATAFRSPQKNSSVPCGMELIASFLNVGQLDLIDESCLSRLYAPNFTGNAQVNEIYFGVSDIYDDAYEPEEVEKKVNLYLFIGVEAGTVVVSIIVICCLIYYIVQLKDKSSEYEEIEE